jgi:hypothetical protein
MYTHTHICAQEKALLEVAVAAQVSKDGMGGTWRTRGSECGWLVCVRWRSRERVRERASERKERARARKREREHVCVREMERAHA